MRPLTSIVSLQQAIQHAKHGASGFTTNFFASTEQIQFWIDRGALFYIEDTHGSLIFRRDRDFHHLYHFAANVDALGTILNKLNESKDYDVTLTSDLIGRNNDVQNLVAVYSQNGFTPYTSLFRMVRLADFDQFSDYQDTDVFFAEPTDAVRIFEFLEGLLDRFAEQIPVLEDIEKAIAQHSILTVRCSQGIGGVLFFKTTGLTSVIRYWFVNKDFRNLGIGARLIKTYFRLCHGECKRITLWVISNYEDAIQKYGHYGFQNDTIVDQIMMRQREA